MTRTIDAGPLTLGVGALLLLISLFVSWWDPAGTAWRVFETWDVVLAGISLAGFVYAGGRLGRPGGPIGSGLAAAALVIVVTQLVQVPPAADGSDLDTGAYLALGGAIVMVIGAALSVASFTLRIDVQGRGRQAEGERRRVAAVDRRDSEPADREPDVRAASLLEDPPDEAPAEPPATSGSAKARAAKRRAKVARAADGTSTDETAADRARRAPAVDETDQRTQPLPTLPPDEG